MDITDLKDIKEISSLGLSGGTGAVDISKDKNFIYVASNEEGIYKIDFSDINEPKLVRTIDTYGYKPMYFSFIKNNRIFVADKYDVAIIDITDPENSILKGSSYSDNIISIFHMKGSD